MPNPSEELEDLLNEDFITELFHIALKSKDLLEIVLANVKDGYLPDQHQKDFLKEVKRQYKVENIKQPQVL